MEFKVEVLRRANLELCETYEYYERLATNLGAKFIGDYENHLDTLYNIPFFENKYNKIRVLPLKIFPYSIHFSVDEVKKLVTIHAVISDRRNPDLTRVK